MTTYSVVWSEKAYANLRRVHDFIRVSSEKGAKKIVKELVLYAQTLENLPRRNPIEPSLVEAPVEYRFLTKWNYKILYTILEENQVVLIVLIFDTRQAPEKLKI